MLRRGIGTPVALVALAALGREPVEIVFLRHSPVPQCFAPLRSSRRAALASQARSGRSRPPTATLHSRHSSAHRVHSRGSGGPAAGQGAAREA
ncbi:hypothetical protein E2C01_064498 [Portunus trituberculatus]|uniref:Uncharacterized protein n=1 Tax=Portunus trituberculatus TaxID=210409 RepID=A0A5B7HJY1_PORTR|nr:hypothetical protein [Portunus trituberculatus]